MALYFTNGDNLLTKSFFTHTLDALATGFNVVATNFVHHMADYQLRGKAFSSLQDMQATNACGGWRPGVDMEFFTQIRPNCVDLASVVTNTSIWEQNPEIRFITTRLGKRGLVKRKALRIQLFIADGVTFEKIAALPAANPHLIRRALVVHQ